MLLAYYVYYNSLTLFSTYALCLACNVFVWA